MFECELLTPLHRNFYDYHRDVARMIGAQKTRFIITPDSNTQVSTLLVRQREDFPQPWRSEQKPIQLPVGRVGFYTRVSPYGQTPHTGDKALEWLKKQGEKNGFQVVSSRIARQTVQKFSAGSRKFFCNDVAIKGALEITDVDKYKDVHMDGIGDHRVFGFGFIILGA